jgi:hypothetical protein
MYQRAGRRLFIGDRSRRKDHSVPKRLLIAIPPALIVAALAAVDAYAGNVNQHAQLLGRVER